MQRKYKYLYIITALIIAFLASITFMSLNSKTTVTQSSTAPVVLASDANNETFKTNLMNAINADVKKNKQFAPMFQNVVASGSHTYQYSPELVSGGVSADGKSYTAVINTHRDGSDVYYIVSGSTTADFKPKTVKVVTANV